MGFFYNKPRICKQNFISVGSVVDNLPAFNALYALKGTGLSQCKDMNDAEKIRWQSYVRDTAINCGGKLTELDFFDKNFSGTTKKTQATDVYIRYNCDKDFNIFAEQGATGSGPGTPVTFTMLRSMHAGDGKWSNVAVNGSIYCYEDQQWLRVTSVDKSIDYAHQVTAIPFSKDYNPSIRGKKKMMFTRIRLVDGYSCAVPSSSWDVPGYVGKVRPFRARADWEIEIDLERPFQDYLRFGLTHDLLGNEVDGFEFMEKTKARQEFLYNKNLQFFLGQKIDNPLLIGAGLALRDDKYSGFDGYINVLRFGGGYVQETDPGVGYSLGSDFMRLMIRQDAMKESNEFFTLAGFPWLTNFTTTSAQFFRENGQITFETFSRAGMSKEDVMRMGIKSYSFMDFTLHFKRMGALSDERSIGNYNMPYMAFMMPGEGLRDENGDPVSAIEFYEAGGTKETGTYYEKDIDHREHPQACEKFSGTITETYQMAVHCPKKHVLLLPRIAC